MAVQRQALRPPTPLLLLLMDASYAAHDAALMLADRLDMAGVALAVGGVVGTPPSCVMRCSLIPLCYRNGRQCSTRRFRGNLQQIVRRIDEKLKRSGEDATRFVSSAEGARRREREKRAPG